MSHPVTSPVARLVSQGLLLVVLAAFGALPAAAEADVFLVADIDTTGEPVFEPCHVTCPPGEPHFGGLPHQLTAWEDRVFFIASDRIHGFEPWVSDGTAQGTRMIADLCPGACDSWGVIQGTVADGVVLWANTRQQPDDRCRLWLTDGEVVEPLGGGEIEGQCQDWPVSDPPPSVSFGGNLFFEGWFQGRFHLVRTDGTAAGTRRVQALCTGSTPCFVRLGDIATDGETVWYATSNHGFADELWRLTEPLGQPSKVAESCHGNIDGPAWLTPWEGGLLFFSGCILPTSSLPWERYLFHLAAEGNDIATVATFSAVEGAAPWGPRHLTRFGDHAYFTAIAADRLAIWRTDGTPGGTGAIGGSFEQGPFFPFVPADDALLFAARTGDQEPVMLWRVDGAGPPDLLLDATIRALDGAAGLAWLAASRPETGEEPWVSDGSAAGTRMLADIAAGEADSQPREFTRAGDLVFFTAETADLGRELWAVRLTSSGEPAPPPPFAEWIEDPEYPDFRFQVRITPPGEAAVAGAHEADCQPDTVCVSGQLPGRSEVFLRVLGPRPNGFLWPTVVRFTPSQVEVWFEQLSTGVVRYYRLDVVPHGEDDLSGRQDRTGFLP